MGLLLAGLLALALAAVGIAFAAVCGLRVWRVTKRVGGEATAALDRISTTTAQIDEQLRLAQASSERLREATARLQRSQAQLQVQADAILTARTDVRRMFWFVPGV